MKVLWFTPSPSLAEDYLNNKPMNAGFIKSLEREIQDKVDLSIAFYHSEKLPFFKYGKTTYYPIYSNNNNFFSNIKKRLLSEIEPESDIIKFKEIIEKVKPDLIHIHGTERPFGLVQEYYLIPTVISIQGNITVCKQKFFSGISIIDVLKYSRIKSWITFNTFFNYFIRFKKQSRREKKIFKISTNFIGRTNWDRRITKILSPKSTYFHNDEILKEIFYEGNWQNKLGETLNLFTTNGPNLFKGIETLILCAQILDSNNINFNWKVAGLSPNDDLVYIASKSLKKKISKNIQFLGKIGDNKLKEAILDSNIYIAVSHIENSPNSLCEALILGIPCIATNAGGTSNFIEDGKNGILIQDGDAYSMAGAIVELKENYDLAVSYGKNARKKALIKHNKSVIVNDLLKIYSNILIKEN
ncbi:MAG: glycosyltransferase [Bacteroidota bacterium]|nr:glycosyltransferase [Bacteroidota bacterium]